MHLSRRLLCAAAALTLAAALPRSASAQTAIPVTDLGTLGGTRSSAIAINNVGDVVGSSRLPNGTSHATMWRQGAIVDLGILCTGCRDLSEAVDINDAGQIVGSSFSASGRRTAVIWQNGVIASLPSPVDDLNAETRANAINNRGQIVGTSLSAAKGDRALLWETPTSVPLDLGALDPVGVPRAAAFAHDINDAGQVVGQASTNNGDSLHAFVWEHDTGMIDLGAAADGCWNYSQAAAINASGTIAGQAAFNCAVHAAMWIDGQIQDLGTVVPGGTSHTARHAINDAGQIAGASGSGLCANVAMVSQQAVVWSEGAIIPLGVQDVYLGCTSSLANGINNRGQVVGVSLTSSGDTRATLWSLETPDTAPPVISVNAVTPTLWPANGKLVPVAFVGEITDEGSGVDAAAYAVVDEYGQVQPSGSIAVDADGSFTVVVSIEARRDGHDRDGRTYSLVVTATDTKGNSSSASAATVILHDARK